MVKMVVLVRHGKAESCDVGIPDETRALTAAGKRSLQAVFPQTFSLLDAPKIHLWTSPKARARQTAEIVADVLDIDEIDEHPSLAEADSAAFLRELQLFEQDVVIAVGHNPFLEEALQQLTSLPIALEKGAAVAVGFAEHEATTGELLWFVQGPDSARWKTLRCMEHIVRTSANTVAEAQQRFFEDPEDEETLHKLRVSIRTARSLLLFVQPYLKVAQGKRMQADLRDLVLETSHLREWDVLCDEVEQLEVEIGEPEPPAPEELSLEEALAAPDPQPTLLEVCRIERAAEQARVLKALTGKKMRRRLKRVVAEADDLSWRGSVERRGSDAGELQRHYLALRRAFESRWAATDFTDAEAVHALRKDAKKLRYAANGYTALLDEAQTGVSEKMERIQDALGALCDARVAKGIIAQLDTRKLAGEANYRLALLEAKQDDCIASTLVQLETMAADASSVEAPFEG